MTRRTMLGLLLAAPVAAIGWRSPVVARRGEGIMSKAALDTLRGLNHQQSMERLIEIVNRTNEKMEIHLARAIQLLDAVRA